MPTLGIVRASRGSAPMPILSHTGDALGQTCAELAELVRVLELVEVGQAGVDGELGSSSASRSSPRSQASTASAARLPPATAWIADCVAGDRVAGGEHAGFRRASGVVVGVEACPRARAR